MNLTTGIVLVGDNGPTSPYMVVMTSDKHRDYFSFTENYAEVNAGRKHASIFIKGQPEQLSQIGNEWYRVNESGIDYRLYSSNIRLYFPQYSADTYAPKSTYILNVYTYIHGVEVELGCYKFRRADALACPPVRFSGMDEYYEYMDFSITDPFALHYDLSANNIRSILGEPGRTNSTGSVLYISLNVVEEGDGCYIKKAGWTGGQNSMMIADPQDMALAIGYNNGDRTVHLALSWNKSYPNLHDYLRETYYNGNYHNGNTTFLWEYVIMDKDDIYYRQAYIKSYEGVGDYDYSFSYDFSIDNYTGPVDPDAGVIVPNSLFTSWGNWKPGLIIQGSVSLYTARAIAAADGDVEQAIPFITIFSNRLPLTEELFSRMLVREGYDSFPKTVDFNLINMNDINLTAINKIEQKVTVVTPTDTAKNHIIQPVFYQTRDLSKINIHPSVIENISLNLDSYKSRVTSFKVQIEGVVFPEIGRTNKGVVFKISGNMLPKSVSSGTLYVLDQDNLLVTSGKFNYIY